MQLIIFLCFLFYFLNAAFLPNSWHLIDAANLAVHEAGHVLLSPFGKFLGIFGGSGLQVLVPFLIAVYFYRRGSVFSSLITLLWVGESIINVGVYAYDGRDMLLPLVGGENAIHDWNYILTTVGLVNYAHGVGVFIKSIGDFVFVITSYFAYQFLYTSKKELQDTVSSAKVPQNDETDSDFIPEGRGPFV